MPIPKKHASGLNYYLLKVTIVLTDFDGDGNFTIIKGCYYNSNQSLQTHLLGEFFCTQLFSALKGQLGSSLETFYLKSPFILVI